MRGSIQELNEYWEEVRPSQSRIEWDYILKHEEAALYGVSIMDAESRNAFDEREDIKDITNIARVDFVGSGIPEEIASDKVKMV